MFLLLAQLFGVAALCGAVVFAGPLAQRWTQSQPMPRCDVGQWPEFNYGFAALRLDLDADMGDPLECEHATTAAGDTEQQTTMGVAHYDRASNTPSFHHGADNWALTLKGLVFWAGEGAVVPASALAVPSLGSARLAAAAGQNSAAVGHGVLATSRQIPAPAAAGRAFLSASQIAGVAKLLGIKNDQVETMTVADMSIYTQASGGSVAQVTRSINSETD